MFGFPLLTLVTTLACLGMLVQTAHSYYLQESPTGDIMKRAAMELVRDKRYTDFQERASSFCTGLCMYEERKPYSECFDLCNWTGRGPSPWSKLDKIRASKDSASDNADSKLDQMAGMMRTGSKPKAGVRTKAGTKKGASWNY